MADPETVRKGQLLDAYADAVSEEIRSSLRDAVPQLSSTEFCDIAKFHKTIDWSNMAQQCQKKICDKLGHQFDESWDLLSMKKKIALLEFLKRRTKNKDVVQWRPYNKSPAEQCRPFIMEVLNGKNYFLQQYLQGQQAKLIEDLVPTIDDYRQRIQKINERRDLLVTHMERMDDTNKHNHEILEDLEHSVRFLRQLNRDADIAARVISDADEVMEE